MSEEKKSIASRILNMPRSTKIQAFIASSLSIFLAAAIPTYAWFNHQREIARIERIKSPDMLFITAANREDKLNINMNNIDVNGKWATTPESSAEYQYFVFSVAGQYVTNYNLQLAHTKNNNFTYEIFEAAASNTNPGGVEGKDYVKYEPNDNRIPSELDDVVTHSGIDTSLPIYYSVKMDRSQTPKEISLNSRTYTIIPATGNAEAVTKSYNGHYINVTGGVPDYDDLANNDYKSKTYEYDKIDERSNPLYWQCTNIPVDDTNNARDPFYHEYILKVSWDKNNIGTLVRKDTDIVYITVSVQ